MSRKTQESVVVAMVRRGGLRRAIKACGFVVAWGIVANELGRTPKLYEYTAYWKQSQSTTTREVRSFSACVPEGVTVEDVWRSVDLRSTSRQEQVAELLGAPWAGRLG
jgi:hypothetical protein